MSRKRKAPVRKVYSDPKFRSELVSKLLIENVRSSGASALIATHNLELAKKFDIIFEIKNGNINLI